MKECPVCKESFQDDLNFCDLDGSPLDGGAATTVTGSSSKLWSFLGIALLVAAVGITAGAILFFPRGPSASLPNGRSQSPTGISGGQPSSMAPDGGRAQADGSATNLDRSAPGSGPSDATAAGSPDQTRLASRKAALSKNDNSDSSLPNPKSVANSDEELTGATRPPTDESRPRTSKSSSTGDAGSAAKAASADSSASDSTARSSAGSAPRHRPKTQAQGDDADPKKDEKKKGGFLRVFKKIFGHG